MREPLRDRGRLEHILEAIDRLLSQAEGLTLESIRRDAIYYYGVVKLLEIVGEAAYKLTPAFREAHPETPWKKIIAMRHVLVHGYYQISDREVLYVIEDDLRPLREQVARYLSETDWGEWEQQSLNV